MESDAEFVQRIKREWDGDNVPCVEDFDHLIALARRGAAAADWERKTRAWIGDPSRPVTFSTLPLPQENSDE